MISVGNETNDTSTYTLCHPSKPDDQGNDVSGLYGVPMLCYWGYQVVIQKVVAHPSAHEAYLVIS
ncbi:hypothetical protein KSC_000250 [Ktedonobacter sp. SOSP1-52]|nr:hypothetical protein KSC_000250 [Ktedonobacter sp. SOSP1-52]